jgi:hypothetical protein
MTRENVYWLLGFLDYSTIIFLLGCFYGWLEHEARQGKTALHVLLAAFTLGFSQGVSFGVKDSKQPRAKNGTFMRRG